MINIREVEWGRDKDAIVGIEREAFSPALASDEADLEEKLSRGFGLIAEENGRELGYLIAYELEKANYPGCREDSHRNINDTAYLESIAKGSNSRNNSPFIIMSVALITELRKRGFKRLTFHTEKGTPFYYLCRFFGCNEVSVHDNFEGMGTNSSYLEYIFGR